MTVCGRAGLRGPVGVEVWDLGAWKSVTQSSRCAGTQELADGNAGTRERRGPGCWRVVTQQRARGLGDPAQRARAHQGRGTLPDSSSAPGLEAAASPAITKSQEEEQEEEETQGPRGSQGAVALPPAWSPTCASGSPNAKYGSRPARLGAVGRARGATPRVAGWPG